MTFGHLALIGHWCKMKKTLVIFMSYCELIIHWDPLVKAHLLQTCGSSLLFFSWATFFQMKSCCRFPPKRSVSLRELQHQLFFRLICGTTKKKKNVLAREVGFVIQNNNNKVISKRSEIKSCSQLSKWSQNRKHKRSAEDSLANKTDSALIVFLLPSCPACQSFFLLKPV